ncbi:MAG TPA: MFS transporter [Myxococcales bacterium]|nr:MFS transporter [Myxococcales bacterium]HIL80644.1 MFS transporter [Myxococcales bacterium]
MFYGWVIVGLAFVVQFIAVGSMMQCFPVFLLPMSEEFGIGRAQAALPPVAMMLSGIVFSPLIGLAISRFPIRNVMIIGAIAMSLGFYALSEATAFWHIVLAYGLTGPLAMGALGSLSCNSLIVNWFERRRSMALGIAMIGMSISGAIMIPAATWGLETWGWRAVYRFFAVVPLGLIPLVAWLVVTRPEDRGLAPDGEQPADKGAFEPAPAQPSSMRQLLAAPTLWLIGAACGLSYFGALAVMNHGIAFAIDRGIDPMRAAGMLSAISVGAAAGKIAFGWLADRLGEKSAFRVALAFQFFALLGLSGLSGYSALVVAGGFFGLGLGGIAPLQAALLARSFPGGNFSRAMGLIAPLMIPFQIAGPPLAGWIFDTQGSYEMAIWIFMVSTVASGVIISLLKLPDTARQAPSI